MCKRTPVFPLAIALVLGALFLPDGQMSAQLGNNAPDMTQLLIAQTPLVGGPADNSAEELPGMGHKFELFGSAEDAQDPHNLTNDVVSTVVDPAGVFAFIVRKLPPGIKIAALDNQLNVKYLFLTANPHPCGGGSPRIQLLIDRNGDGSGDGNAFGYVGRAGFGAGCISGRWDIIDMTDDVPARWDLTQFGLGYHTWDTAETSMTTAYPLHQVLTAALVDDTFVGST